jgi:hypothetical protein
MDRDSRQKAAGDSGVRCVCFADEFPLRGAAAQLVRSLSLMWGWEKRFLSRQNFRIPSKFPFPFPFPLR